VIWDVQALIDGRDAEPFLLFSNGDPYHSRCYRFEVLGGWDAGRLVVFEYYLPEEASRGTLRKAPAHERFDCGCDGGRSAHSNRMRTLICQPMI
jgi:hypothetical protein